MTTQRTVLPHLAWIICLVLLLTLLGVAWFAWNDLRNPANAFKPEQQASLAAIATESAALAPVIQDLRAFLEADPCAIPAESNGFPLAVPTANAAPSQPLPSPRATPSSGYTEPQTPSPQGSPAPRPVPATLPAASFTADNAAIEAATVLVLSEVGDDFAMGTGFFVAPGIILTNRHVVEEATGAIAFINKKLGRASGSIIAMTREHDRDYALVRVDPGANTTEPLPQPLPLCGDIAKADKVGAWGFPGVISSGDPKFQALLQGDARSIPENIYSEGVVSVIYDTMPPMILHSAELSGGNSGGPLVNAEGCVVGINTMIKLDDQSYRQTSISLSSKDIATYLWQNGITPLYRSEAQN